MSVYKPTIKKWNTSGSAWDTIYPKTTIDQVLTLATSLANMQTDIDEAHELLFVTSCPTANNDVGKKLYVGSTNCTTKYSGWIYHII